MVPNSYRIEKSTRKGWINYRLVTTDEQGMRTGNLITSFKENGEAYLAELFEEKINEKNIHGLGELRALRTDIAVSMAREQQQNRNSGYFPIPSFESFRGNPLLGRV
jgi:hypothetical protein